MIDRSLLLTDFENTARRLARKGESRETLEQARRFLEERRRLLVDLENGRAEVNRLSKQVGQLFQQGKKDEAEQQRAAVGVLNERIATLEQEVAAAESGADAILLRIPNLPDDRAPEGTSEADNVVVRTMNYDAEQYRGRVFRPHWELATALGIFDAERASKLSGSGFALLRGDGARLLRALVQYGLDLHREKYVEFVPPHFVRSETFTGTGHLPKFEADAYRLRDDDLWAIPTGEVPLTGMHRGELFEEDDLPKRYMAYTVCFRREAGSAGKDTRGLQRVHEFHKVELLRICAPERAEEEFAALLADAERSVTGLGFPYRVVDLCQADLTFSSSRIFDLEVYAPGVDRWLEVSSVGLFTDFQARRSNIRFRRKGKKGGTAFPYFLNASALATPRMWAAVIEHGQQPDGSIRVPDALVKYMGTDRIGPP